ncbi:MAG: hybrid sensor histidine kinase/response regulator [SAR324 cluster bacterium]|nr:hybrid sensor histidine kinase/response regulator [SAR324 cluster bacterium]
MSNKPTVLIVDDTPENIKVVMGVLRDQYKLMAALNGPEALEIAEKNHPDLILLDIMMPEMDGYAVCQQLKKMPETKDIPIIFLTAKTQPEDIVKGFEQGAVDYVTKPFNVMELQARVKTHLALKFSQETVLQKNAEQKELLHILCHDLVNPMAVVKTYLEMGAKKPADWLEAKRNMMLMAMETGLETVDLIRKMRALEDGKIKIRLTSAPVKVSVERSISMLHQKFEEKNINPVLNIDEKLCVQVEETSFISSVLNNIFTNAVKFSFTDSRILVNAKQEGESVVISIQDFGIGMSDRLINDLFDISKTTNRSGTNGEPGTGYGMPLMKKFITLYGGSLKIISKEKTGFSDDHGTQIILNLKSC